jgi:4-hydroxy-tetrahydrodipicolinate synthase
MYVAGETAMARVLRREDLHTVQLVQITAYAADGKVALDTMRTHATRLVEAGIRVIIPCAGSSEFHSLMADEIIATISAIRDAVGPEPVIMAPIGLQPKYAADLGARSLDAGADAVLIMPLSFPYLSDEGAGVYYLALMDQLQCPTLIYKKDPLPSDELLLELADNPHLIGIKYAVNDLNAFNVVVEKDRRRIDWFCGSAERFAPFFALAGAPGYTSGAGNLCPRLTLAMHAALASGEWQEAMRLIPVTFVRGNRSWREVFRESVTTANRAQAYQSTWRVDHALRREAARLPRRRPRKPL